MAYKAYSINEAVLLDATFAETDLLLCITALKKSGPQRQELSIHYLDISFNRSQDNLDYTTEFKGTSK